MPGLLDGRWEEVADETGALFFFFFFLLQMVLFDVELKESDGRTDGRSEGSHGAIPPKSLPLLNKKKNNFNFLEVLLVSTPPDRSLTLLLSSFHL